MFIKPIITMGFSLSFYGKKDVIMKQIVFQKTNETNFKTLLNLLNEQNYIVKEGDYSIGICLDVEDKVLFPLNVTCMCGFSKDLNRPLLDLDILQNYESLVINKDNKLLDKLYRRAKKDLSRPIGGFFR